MNDFDLDETAPIGSDFPPRINALRQSALAKADLLRLQNQLMKDLDQILQHFMYEPNDARTRSAIWSHVETYMTNQKMNRTIYNYMAEWRDESALVVEYLPVGYTDKQQIQMTLSGFPVAGFNRGKIGSEKIVEDLVEESIPDFMDLFEGFLND